MTQNGWAPSQAAITTFTLSDLGAPTPPHRQQPDDGDSNHFGVAVQQQAAE